MAKAIRSKKTPPKAAKRQGEWLFRIHREYGPRIFQIALNRLNDREWARDAVQEVFLQLARRPHLSKGIENEEKYLSAMARRVSLNMMLKRNRWPVTGLPNESVTEPSFRSPVHMLLERDFFNRMEHAIEKWDPRLQFLGRMYLGSIGSELPSVKELADAMSVPVNTAKTRMRRVRQLFLAELEKERKKSFVA
ncbi:MAG: sigma-70 family RNA polymerase sigma factor [Candidatus Diapherotrites archaeon]|uniref:Sigma-70 family RNA polymerase sigma factor n=1 Tax=Candidatus Iainarchaeum sp. TaxID=3101447 RepID=A0A8T4L5Q2_9ARCH|nr:sigma-70 family RNA polymerase sigma factor [Candidatus Diapherotrites archaeon]